MQQADHPLDDVEFVLGDLEPLVEGGNQLASDVFAWEAAKVIERSRDYLMRSLLEYRKVLRVRFTTCLFLSELSLLLEVGCTVKDTSGTRASCFCFGQSASYCLRSGFLRHEQV